jgi:hypothetical protein
MSPNTPSPTELVRRAFLKFDELTVLSAVDSLDLRGQGKISAVVGIPLRNLQQRRDVRMFATSAPVAALRGLLELLAMDPLDKVVVALGDYADNPTYEQLADAVDQLLTNGATDDDVVALLAFAIVESFPAGLHCRQLLLERPAFELPELPDVVVSTSLLAPKETDPEVREQRKARREQEKQRKKGPSSIRPARPVKAKRATKQVASLSPLSVVSLDDAPLTERRRMLLTPLEQERFSNDHPIVGWVVLVEVPFDAVDPMYPEQKSKERPALVIAATDDSVLVRALYSNPAVTRQLFPPWRRIGLDHVSYIDDARTPVTASVDAVERLGQLNLAEWNSLF